MEKKYSNIYIILGDIEKGDKRVAKLISEYQISDLDIKTIYAEDKNLEKIFEEIDYPPFFSKKRLVHIKNCEKLTKLHCEKLEGYFPDLSKYVCIVFTGVDIKSPLKKYAQDVVVSKQQGLFPKIFSLRRKEDKKQLVALFMEHLESNERDFTPIITAAEIYLKNLLLNQRKLTPELINKFKTLYQLDFDLKVGKLHTGPEFEIFLYYLFN